MLSKESKRISKVNFLFYFYLVRSWYYELGLAALSISLPCRTMAYNIEITPFILIHLLLLFEVSNRIYLGCFQPNASLVLRISTITYCDYCFSRLPTGDYSFAFDITYLMSEGVIIWSRSSNYFQLKMLINREMDVVIMKKRTNLKKRLKLLLYFQLSKKGFYLTTWFGWCSDCLELLIDRKSRLNCKLLWITKDELAFTTYKFDFIRRRDAYYKIRVSKYFHLLRVSNDDSYRRKKCRDSTCIWYSNLAFLGLGRGLEI